MKELWKKYTRTQDQRSALVFIVVVLSFLIFMAVAVPGLLIILAFMGAVFGAMFGVGYLISRWVSRGDSY